VKKKTKWMKAKQFKYLDLSQDSKLEIYIWSNVNDDFES